MNYYFTSDLHFGHRNIIKYSKRPFSSIEDMNESLIDNWNKVVKPGDSIYCLGDFALCPAKEASNIARRLNGQKFLVFGNHDKATRKDSQFLGHWSWAKDLADINIGEQKIVLSHYAFRVWNKSHHGSWNLHGHSHGSLKDENHMLQVDVGVDCWDYSPVSIEDLVVRMKTKKYKPVDHHGDRGEM